MRTNFQTKPARISIRWSGPNRAPVSVDGSNFEIEICPVGVWLVSALEMSFACAAIWLAQAAACVGTPRRPHSPRQVSRFQEKATINKNPIRYYTCHLMLHLRYNIRCCAMLCYAILDYTVLFPAILFYPILYYTVLHYTIVVLYDTMLRNTTLYYSIVYYTILY